MSRVVSMIAYYVMFLGQLSIFKFQLWLAVILISSFATWLCYLSSKLLEFCRFEG